MVICWERAVSLVITFHLCCFSSVPSQLLVSLSRLVFRAGCGLFIYALFSVFYFSSSLGVMCWLWFLIMAVPGLFK